jgi:hypothetical protein
VFEIECVLCLSSCFRLCHIRRLADTILDRVKHSNVSMNMHGQFVLRCVDVMKGVTR